MKIKEYKILEASSPLQLQERVMSKIADGYEILGSPVSVPASYGDNFLHSRNNIAQAMVLYHSQEHTQEREEIE